MALVQSFSRSARCEHGPRRDIVGGEEVADRPDLSPLDWELWSGVNAFLAEKYHNVAQLKVAVAKKYREYIGKTGAVDRVATFKRRLQACIDADGGHFEL